MALHREGVERDGWRLFFVAALPRRAELANAQFVGQADAELVRKAKAELLERVLAAGCGRLGRPFRRSRHAATYWVRNGGTAESNGDAFIKVFDAPRGLRKLRYLFRQPREEYAARIVDELTASGINAPPVLLYGRETATRCGIIATARAQGEVLPMALRMTGAEGLPHKRALLRALGEEIARLHRAGFVHGDLTPYNVIVERGEPPRFVFIDNERTHRAPIAGRMRSRLRNLVQLGRFELLGLTRADRVRVLRAYADALVAHQPRGLMRRAASMLALRLERDRLAKNRQT